MIALIISSIIFAILTIVLGVAFFITDNSILLAYMMMSMGIGRVIDTIDFYKQNKKIATIILFLLSFFTIIIAIIMFIQNIN